MSTCFRFKHVALLGILPALLVISCKHGNIIGNDVPILSETTAHAKVVAPPGASLPNPGFENWSSSANPDHWTFGSLNGAARTSDSHSGNSAVRIWNWYQIARGYVTNGVEVNRNPGYEFNNKGGVPLNTRPVALTGYYKYVYGQNGGRNDSAVALIALRKYNPATGKSEKVAYTEMSLGPVSGYQRFRVPVNYVSSQVPDSMVITILSSRNGLCSPASTCLFLTVDDLALECHSGKSIPVEVQ